MSVSSSLRESLAALAHDQWSGWTRYLFDQCIFNEDFTVTIPAGFALRWLRQAGTTYGDLPENEKDSDRHQADRVLAVIEQCGER